MRTNYICFGLATAGACLLGYKLYLLFGFGLPMLAVAGAAVFFSGMFVASALFHCGRLKPVGFEHAESLPGWLGAALRPVTLLAAIALGCGGAYAWATVRCDCPTMDQIQNVNYSFHTQEALKLCDRYARFHPYDAELWAQRSYAESTLFKFDDSIACGRTALRFDPNNVDALVNLGWALDAKDNYKEALECSLKALKFDLDDGEAWHVAGDAYFGTNKFDKALEAFQRHSKIHPNESEGWDRLAETYEKLGMTDDAKKARDEAHKHS